MLVVALVLLPAVASTSPFASCRLAEDENVDDAVPLRCGAGAILFTVGGTEFRDDNGGRDAAQQRVAKLDGLPSCKRDADGAERCTFLGPTNIALSFAQRARYVELACIGEKQGDVDALCPALLAEGKQLGPDGIEAAVGAKFFSPKRLFYEWKLDKAAWRFDSADASHVEAERSVDGTIYTMQLAVRRASLDEKKRIAAVKHDAKARVEYGAAEPVEIACTFRGLKSKCSRQDDARESRIAFVTWQGVVDGRGFIVECSGATSTLARGCSGALDDLAAPAQ
jgi:hypothetical protein